MHHNPSHANPTELLVLRSSVFVQYVSYHHKLFSHVLKIARSVTFYSLSPFFSLLHLGPSLFSSFTPLFAQVGTGMTVRTWQLWSTALRPWTGTRNLTVVPCYPYLHRLLTCPCRSGSHMFDTKYRLNTCTGTETLCLTGLSWKHFSLVLGMWCSVACDRYNICYS
jgi:hypothetical protein